MFRHHCLFAACVLSCAGSPAPVQPPPAPVPPPSTSAPPIVQPAATSSAASEPVTPSSLYPFAKGFSLRVWHLGTSVLVTSGDDGHSIAELRGEELVQDPELARGIESCWNEGTLLHGKWPDAAWMIRDWTAWAVRAPVGGLYRWKGGRWTRVMPVNLHELKLAVVPGVGTLAVEVPRRSGPPWGYRLRWIEGAGPRLFPMAAEGKPTGPYEPTCYTRLETPLALLAFSPRNVMVLGSQECVHDPDAEASHLVVERWSDGKHELDRLPLRAGMDGPPAWVASGPADVWIAGRSLDESRDESVLVHWDGVGWREQGGALPGSVRAMDRDGDVFYVVAEQAGQAGLWRGVPGRWEQLALPRDAEAPLEVFVHKPGDPWVVTENAIYRSKPVERVFEWKPVECRGDEQAAPPATDAPHVGGFEF